MEVREWKMGCSPQRGAIDSGGLRVWDLINSGGKFDRNRCCVP